VEVRVSILITIKEGKALQDKLLIIGRVVAEMSGH
jgi:hypothetical protein